MNMRVIGSRYDGECAVCGNLIQDGEPVISIAVDGAFAHESCWMEE